MSMSSAISLETTSDDISYIPSDTVDALYAVTQTKAWKKRSFFENTVKKTGVLVLPGDLVCKSEELSKMVNEVRMDSSNTAMWSLFGKKSWSDKPLPGSSDKPKIVPDILYSISEKNNLVNVISFNPQDIETESCLNSNKSPGNLNLCTNINDLHTYVLRPYVLDFLVATRKISTAKDLPFENDIQKDQRIPDLANNISCLQQDVVNFLLNYRKIVIKNNRL